MLVRIPDEHTLCATLCLPRRISGRVVTVRKYLKRKLVFFRENATFVVYDIILDNLRQAVIIITLQIVINYDLLASSKNSNGMMYRVWSASRIKKLDKATEFRIHVYCTHLIIP